MMDKRQEYVESYGWEYVIIDEKNILTGFSDKSKMSYPVLISSREEIVTITCTFQIKSDILIEFVDKLILLLRFNFYWPLVKVGLDDDGFVVLALDLPISGLTYDSFEFALDVFTETAQMLVAELPELSISAEIDDEIGSEVQVQPFGDSQPTDTMRDSF